MPKRPDRPPRRRRAGATPPTPPPGGRPRRRGWIVALGLALGVAAAGLLGIAAARRRPPRDALRDRLRQARSALDRGLAREAEAALRAAIEADPAAAEPTLRLLDLYRLEDRPVEARSLATAALGRVSGPARLDILRGETLALLTDAPEAVARPALARFAEADPDDLDARLALLRRDARVGSRPGDSGGAERVARLAAWLARAPGHAGVREALALDLADRGDWKAVRTLLDAWPEAARDARHRRLLGRWELDARHRPDRAEPELRAALAEIPHDPGTRANLARALGALGRPGEARREADALDRLREILDPARLGARLDADLARLERPGSIRDLAALCESVGLTRLAEDWRREIVRTTPSPSP